MGTQQQLEMFSWFHATVGKPGFPGISTFLVFSCFFFKFSYIQSVNSLVNLKNGELRLLSLLRLLNPPGMTATRPRGSHDCKLTGALIH